MNKRGFLATLAAICVAPFAAKAATELAYPDSVLHKIRAESKAAVYKDLAERSVRILPR